MALVAFTVAGIGQEALVVIGAGQCAPARYPHVKLVVGLTLVMRQYKGFATYLQFQPIAEIAGGPNQVRSGGGQLLLWLAHVFGQGAAQANVAIEAFLQQFMADDFGCFPGFHNGPGAVGVINMAVGVDDSVNGHVAD